MIIIMEQDISGIDTLIQADPSLAELIHPALPYTKAMVIWGVKEEWAISIEDILSRRTRAILLDAKAALEAAPGSGFSDG